MKTQKIVGRARIVDWSEDRTTCRVRLCDEDGLPNGAVLTGVKYLPYETVDRRQQSVVEDKEFAAASLSGHELDTMAQQNLFYNSHHPVTIE